MATSPANCSVTDHEPFEQEEITEAELNAFLEQLNAQNLELEQANAASASYDELDDLLVEPDDNSIDVADITSDTSIKVTQLPPSPTPASLAVAAPPLSSIAITNDGCTGNALAGANDVATTATGANRVQHDRDKITEAEPDNLLRGQAGSPNASIDIGLSQNAPDINISTAPKGASALSPLPCGSEKGTTVVAPTLTDLTSGAGCAAPAASVTSKAHPRAASTSEEALDYEDEELDDRDLYAERYAFPADAVGPWPELVAKSNGELADELYDLSNDRNGKGRLHPYQEIRTRVCAISIELNRRAKLAPRFRDMRHAPMKVKTINGRNLSCDRQVIDLHWLHCSGWNPYLFRNYSEIRRLKGDPKFKWSEAVDFATKPAPFNEKADLLCMPDHIAFQLAAIQTNAIRERFRVAQDGDTRASKVVQLGRRQVMRELANSTANQPHLQEQVPRWAMIWMCSRLVGEKAELLRQFHALTEGLEKPLDARDIARRLATVKKRLQKEHGAMKSGA